MRWNGWRSHSLINVTLHASSAPMPKQVLRRHLLAYEQLEMAPHFERDGALLSFRRHDLDPLTGRPVLRLVRVTAATRGMELGDRVRAAGGGDNKGGTRSARSYKAKSTAAAKGGAAAGLTKGTNDEESSAQAATAAAAAVSAATAAAAAAAGTTNGGEGNGSGSSSASASAASSAAHTLAVQRFADLLAKMLTLDPARRLAPADALKHAFITGVSEKERRKAEKEREREREQRAKAVVGKRA